MKHKNIPNSLRKYRKARDLKQKDVARILGLKGSSMISRWEKGVCIPSTQNLMKLAVLYRTLMDALFVDLARKFKETLLKREKEILRKKSGQKNIKKKDKPISVRNTEE